MDQLRVLNSENFSTRTQSLWQQASTYTGQTLLPAFVFFKIQQLSFAKDSDRINSTFPIKRSLQCCIESYLIFDIQYSIASVSPYLLIIIII